MTRGLASYFLELFGVFQAYYCSGAQEEHPCDHQHNPLKVRIGLVEEGQQYTEIQAKQFRYEPSAEEIDHRFGQGNQAIRIWLW